MFIRNVFVQNYDPELKIITVNKNRMYCQLSNDMDQQNRPSMYIKQVTNKMLKLSTKEIISNSNGLKLDP